MSFRQSQPRDGSSDFVATSQPADPTASTTTTTTTTTSTTTSSSSFPWPSSFLTQSSVIAALQHLPAFLSADRIAPSSSTSLNPQAKTQAGRNDFRQAIAQRLDSIVRHQNEPHQPNSLGITIPMTGPTAMVGAGASDLATSPDPSVGPPTNQTGAASPHAGEANFQRHLQHTVLQSLPSGSASSAIARIRGNSVGTFSASSASTLSLPFGLSDVASPFGVANSPSFLSIGTSTSSYGLAQQTSLYVDDEHSSSLMSTASALTQPSHFSSGSSIFPQHHPQFFSSMPLTSANVATAAMPFLSTAAEENDRGGGEGHEEDMIPLSVALPHHPQQHHHAHHAQTIGNTRSHGCEHVGHWKHLRSRRGYAYFMCFSCGVKWRVRYAIPANRRVPSFSENQCLGESSSNPTNPTFLPLGLYSAQTSLSVVNTALHSQTQQHLPQQYNGNTPLQMTTTCPF